MSCLGENYNPTITRVWERVENVCTFDDPDNMKHKANILQYKKNSGNMTKKERYSRIAQGKWNLRKTSWATQTQTVTNPDVGIPTICPVKVYCNPNSNSDVPGKRIMLCSTNDLYTIYPRTRTVMTSGGNKFPEGYKFN